ncbi:2-succinyl-5-enolpyruvyl-6-hydroxy-3-cyclohexene-1-carboxylic-acid synthase [Sulfoacidibacillus thermotolerans]|uniref:2-succinyl-5-enolpyruvyl-6-hydroxy-3-cyclohexene-1-carboxylate synthase n=1 Tax=Sulfoacidibacillus thermotolerans TaxID=1765684 RepID=A0A2U3D9E6_SULT2|nr:2-succinyl-5-enolpyruvyl-6-hydroxy-3-cyclohexene-1-carboxylic-acid synthase [Sulfoacidibacillus thermotolerans]PWI57908.1 2-succinyl-5-enolpyruvyl-6-hydroxy-3-cyclohexene-1-carboxylic-acid synthase [Sulfoacidibacillus thermotolerans]
MTVNPHLEVVHVFVAALEQLGVRHVCISPGSRSTPLTIAFARHPGFKVWTLLDERSAAYFALGLAQQTRQPVVLLCTSGTAAANYLPAVVEARFSRVPLLVFTADRPKELRAVGANQTIDQVNLYGSHVKWSLEMPTPDGTAELLPHARQMAVRLVTNALSAPQGPVHLNWPFREPLLPPQKRDVESEFIEHVLPMSVAIARKQFTELELQNLADIINRIERVLFIVGPQFDQNLAEPLLQIALKLKIPILADPLSQLRAVAQTSDLQYIIDHYDSLLRHQELVEAKFLTQWKPELVIRLGQMPVSKVLGAYLAKLRGVRQLAIDDASEWRDPIFGATDVWQTDPVLLLQALNRIVPEREESLFAANWRALNEQIADCQRKAIDAIEGQMRDQFSREQTFAMPSLLFEGRIFLELAHLLPPHTTLYVGNSMPVRDLDSFFGKINKPMFILGNRGASGIDGVVSSALGASAGHTNGPTVLVIGDISFFHDLNGLLAAKQYRIDLTVILVHNDGGGIFSFLPQATQDDVFPYFETPHGLEFQSVITMYQGVYKQISDWETFRREMTRSIAEGGLRVLELRTNRELNVLMHRKVFQTCREELLP